jgi:subtilase family serine protease
MKNRLVAAVIVAIAAVGTAVLPSATSSASGASVRHACAAARGDVATCFAEFRDGGRQANADTKGPQGLTPAEIAAAYDLPIQHGFTQTIAIVDAYDDPRAESDLAVFRKQFGLPACTTANHCFRKMNQRGATKPLPAGDPDWGVEISLDLQAVSSSCPRCHILLVEADSAEIDNLGIAVNTAVAQHVTAVSNSYGVAESTDVKTFGKKYYTHPGTSIVVSTGDDGFQPAAFPASLPTTIAVGGTTLTRAPTTKRGWKEEVWSGAGSGCSAYFAKPSWQKDRNCPMRTVADVSAVADPDTGLSVYDTYGLGADNGWIVVGGTSLSAPLIAGVMGTVGAKLSNASYIYAHRNSLYDVTGGSNALYMDCGDDYLCTGLPGYDAPSGLGTPHGRTAF